jgi:sigma-B regulation protein RsbU (phosphoserine phosphatase)
LFVGVLNLKNGVLRYCNAAHTTSIIVKTEGDLLELEQSHGMPLGLYPNKAYKVSKTVLQKNDTLFLYTDGVTDLQNEEKKQFGYPALLEKLTNCVNKDPKTVIGHIEHELETFKLTAKQVDDITILAVKYNGKKKA